MERYYYTLGTKLKSDFCRVVSHPQINREKKKTTTERNERNLESRDSFALCVAGLGVGVLKYASQWNTISVGWYYCAR